MKSRIRGVRFFLISMILHGGVFFLKRGPLNTESPRPVWVELEPRSVGSPGPSKSLKSLAIRGLYGPESLVQVPGTQLAKRESWGGGLEGGIDLKKESAHAPFFAALYRQINSNVIYPQELYERGTQGRVEAEIRFDSEGKWNPETSSFQSTSRYLNVLVQKTLRKALSEPIPRAQKKFPNGFSVVAVFVFEITEHHDEDFSNQRRNILSNRMQFYRFHHESALAWKLGPLKGIGPFLPTVGLDLMWFPKKIKEALSNKAKIDPLDRYREDSAW